MKRFDCLGFGLATLDHLSLVERFPRPGLKLEVIESTIDGGGPVATALASMARLGLNVAFCGRLGNDAAGKLIVESFERSGVCVDHLSLDPKATTPTATVLMEQNNGRRTVLLNRGRGCKLPSGEVTEQLIAGARAVHLDGRDLVRDKQVARLARKLGVITSLDVGSLRNDVSSLLPYIDHLVVAEEYALGATGERSLRVAAQNLWQDSMKSLIITQGSKGALGYDGHSYYSQAAFEVDVKDVTGAGDAFHGGYLHGVLKGWPLPQSLRFAAATAALNCSELGGRAGLPSLAQVRRLLKQGERDV